MEALVSSTASFSWLILKEFPFVVRLCFSDFGVFNPKHDITLPIFYFSHSNLKILPSLRFALFEKKNKVSQRHTHSKLFFSIQTMTSWIEIEAHNLNKSRFRSKTRGSFIISLFFWVSSWVSLDTYRILRLSGVS